MPEMPPFSEEYAGLRYTLTFPPASPDGVRTAFLTLPGGGARPLSTFHHGADTPPEQTLARVQGLARLAVARAAELRRDAEEGWAITLEAGNSFDLVEEWVLSDLDRRRVPFHTAWMPCACGQVRHRLRRGPQGYRVTSQAAALNWDELAQELLETATTLAAPLGTPTLLREAAALALREPLLLAAQGDPEITRLALEASSFEVTVPSLEAAVAVIGNEQSELHGQVEEQRQGAAEVLERHLEEVLHGGHRAGPEAGGPDLQGSALVETLLDLEDGDHQPLMLFEQVRRRRPRPLRFPDVEAAENFVEELYEASGERMPLLSLRPGQRPPLGQFPGQVPIYVMDLVELITGDASAGETAGWVAESHPEWSAAQTLWWLWEEYRRSEEAPGALQETFEDLEGMILWRDRPPFRDAEGLHTYLHAQLEANGWRVYQGEIGGEPSFLVIGQED